MKEAKPQTGLIMLILKNLNEPRDFIWFAKRIIKARSK
ncbi:MAG: hypothetical protein UZ20_WS6002000110 [candidate division WS6 bacterium OLB21]|uniref:Uncharacterized protein n=1 Tax=candidate division WS6 bacterium OLB21 TaxID=1617427 RepID=A0A136KKU1_9BACT|nr:MAG: hypothetical protein UZ20_WS6002000110 [candidate division WS6 bacterium OLB21]